MFLEESVTHSMLILEGFFTFSGKYSTWFLYDPAISVCKLSGIKTNLSFLGVVTITIHNVKTLSISCHVQRETMQWDGFKTICWAEHHLPGLFVKGLFEKRPFNISFCNMRWVSRIYTWCWSSRVISCPQCHQTAGCTGWSGSHMFIQDIKTVRSWSVTITHVKGKRWDAGGPEVRNREMLVVTGGQNLPHTDMDGQAGKWGEAGHTSYLEVQLRLKYSAHLDLKITLKLILTCWPSLRYLGSGPTAKENSITPYSK